MVKKLTHFGGPNIAAQSVQQTWDDSNTAYPSSLLLIRADDPIHEAATKIKPELFLMSELDLEEKIRGRKEGQFDRTLGLLKISYWDEYSRSIHNKCPLKTENVWRPLTTQSWWNTHILQNSIQLAWLITPPADELIVQKEMLQFGYKKLREVLDLPLTEKTKGFEYVDNIRKTVIVEKVNIPLIKEMHSIIRTIADRVNGSVVQHHKILSKNLNVNVPATPESLNPSAEVVEKPVTIEATKEVASSSPVLSLPTLNLDAPLTLSELDAYEAKLKSIEGLIRKVVVLNGEEIDADTPGK